VSPTNVIGVCDDDDVATCEGLFGQLGDGMPLSSAAWIARSGVAKGRQCVDIFFAFDDEDRPIAIICDQLRKSVEEPFDIPKAPLPTATCWFSLSELFAWETKNLVDERAEFVAIIVGGLRFAEAVYPIMPASPDRAVPRPALPSRACRAIPRLMINTASTRAVKSMRKKLVFPSF
jgi:hypothetical protein